MPPPTTRRLHQQLSWKTEILFWFIILKKTKKQTNHSCAVIKSIPNHFLQLGCKICKLHVNYYFNFFFGGVGVGVSPKSWLCQGRDLYHKICLSLSNIKLFWQELTILKHFMTLCSAGHFRVIRISTVKPAKKKYIKRSPTKDNYY